MGRICRQVSSHPKIKNRPNSVQFRIHYSERYCDDKYEYRHVILPKPLLKLIPKQYFNDDDSGTLRLLSEKEWRGIGITQSLGWVHYEVHSKHTYPSYTQYDNSIICIYPAPEPHVLLFRRELDYKPPQSKLFQGLKLHRRF